MNYKKLTRKQLAKKIDELRRKFVRKRDALYNGFAICISCSIQKPVSELQVGHFYLRGYDQTTELLTEWRNVSLQCQRCNGFMHGNLSGYAVGLVRKYGPKVLFELEKKRKTEKHWSYMELLAVVEELKKKAP